MKIKNISDINKFLEIVDECEEKVELITSQDDCINLKGTMSKYIAAVMLINNLVVQQGDIIIYSPKDAEKLMGFFA